MRESNTSLVHGSLGDVKVEVMQVVKPCKLPRQAPPLLFPSPKEPRKETAIALPETTFNMATEVAFDTSMVNHDPVYAL
jgi:hypothetical protein